MSGEESVPVNIELNPSIDSNKEIDSIYAEELELNIPCDDDENHIVVLYCMKCEVSLCVACSVSLHSRRAISKHQISRLTNILEPLVFCLNHPYEIAALMCKQPGCDGMNNPICAECHCQKHKFHITSNLDEEYKTIKEKIVNNLVKIEEQLAVCKANCEEYEKCISSYSCDEDKYSFVSSEREKIKQFFANAGRLALEKLDDFSDHRIEELKAAKIDYMGGITELSNISLALRNIEKMTKSEVIKCGGNVELLAKAAKKGIKDPSSFHPPTEYKVIHPSNVSLNIHLEKAKGVHVFPPGWYHFIQLFNENEENDNLLKV